MTLARFGADVIKVEIPKGGDPVRALGPFAGPEGVNPTKQTDQDIPTKFLKRTQGVKSVTLNLKDPEGRSLFLQLAKQSDVVIENLAPGSMKRLGLGYKDVAGSILKSFTAQFPVTARMAHTQTIRRMTIKSKRWPA